MKNLIYPILMVLAVLTQSCDTDIPETDTTPPEFTFRITGDGFEHVFNPTDDYNSIQLNLKSGAEYDFIYVGSDDGGVKLIQWQVPNQDYIEFISTIPDPWTAADVSALSRMIQWSGNPNNPITGNILSGTFETNGELVSLSFRFYVSDFGGESGSSNSVSKELTIYIGDHDTEIIEF